MKRAVFGERRYFHDKGFTPEGGNGAGSVSARSFFSLIFPRAGVLAVLFFVLAVAWNAAAVEGLRLESLAPGELRVEWTAPDSTPPPFRYRVNWSPVGESFPGLEDSGGNTYSADTALTLGNLRPGVEYQVRVGEGSGPLSAPAVQRVDEYGSEVGSGESLGFGEEARGWIGSPGDVDWFEVSLEAGESYYAEAEGEDGFLARLIGVYDARGGIVEEGVERSGTSALVFTSGSVGTYYVSVAGTGERVGAYGVRVQEELPGGIIRGLELGSGGLGTLAVRWEEVSPAPSYYRLSWAEVDESYPGGWNLGGNAYASGTSHTLGGLDPKEVYKVRVGARYAGGEGSGPWAEAVSTQDTVSGLELGSDAAGELRVVWREPSPAPAGYLLSWARMGESYGSGDEAYVSGTSRTLVGLDHAEEYKVRVEARYGEGSEEWRAPWGEGFRARRGRGEQSGIRGGRREQSGIRGGRGRAASSRLRTRRFRLRVLQP